MNARSTPATYSGARWTRCAGPSPAPRGAGGAGFTAGALLVQHAAGQCPTCRGLGEIDLDVQYLPDINVVCPTCHGARYAAEVLASASTADDRGRARPDRAGGTRPVRVDRAAVGALRPIADVGLPTCGSASPTPSLSGGESQRLRIASKLRTSQRGALYVFDEPSTGLHPLDIRALVR